MRLLLSVCFLLTSLSSYSKHINDPLITSDTYPNETLTPGDIFPDKTAAEVCIKGYAQSMRKVTKGVKRQIKKDYGILPRQFENFTIDHFVPLSLGGSNDKKNLWPQRVSGIAYGVDQKTLADNYLYKEVCEGRMRLAKAQNLILKDWVRVFLDCCFNSTLDASEKHKREKGRKGDFSMESEDLLREVLDIDLDFMRDIIEMEFEILNEELELLEDEFELLGEEYELLKSLS